MKRLQTYRPGLLLALIAVHVLCTAFFLWDVMDDLQTVGWGFIRNPHLSIEMIAALSLILALVFEIRYLMGLLRRKAHLESQVSIAAGAFHEILQAHFDDWQLSPAERDVAMFAVKGCSIAETAHLRGSAEGTVKSQLNAVYRKAGVPGRGALLGLLIDDLVEAPLLPDPQTTQQRATG